MANTFISWRLKQNKTKTTALLTKFRERAERIKDKLCYTTS